ncbi:MAG: sigma-70 family RNA polymerase sigma factor [Planctomycetota bacterium]|jgi:RNA polymerase sigma-70 factor, ECF subfamily|nr:sigma-70 family RNA polymerase sigma factor [Planctomycetota bacterium]
MTKPRTETEIAPELLAAVLADDPAAFDLWYRSEHPTVYRLCVGLLAEAAEAEDAAQDAMLHLHDKLHHFDVRRAYEPWRNTVVLNLCRDRLRRMATRRAAESVEPLPPYLPRPDEVAHSRELAQMLQTALAELTPREREAFVLRDLSGNSTAATAEALGVTAGTVRSLLTLARRRLRRLLGPRLPEYSGAPSSSSVVEGDRS